ncbi:guanine deaminase [Pokkaliibacter sp. CJK22405]|uniref:guanine deaminase n=1 Tax=Pokkaliibacter sp. CJK22405 TaxID=3384615 RepID=UPI003984FAB4
MATAYRSAFVYCLEDPSKVSPDQAMVYEPDGLLVVEEGKIIASGKVETLLPTLPAGTEVITFADALIMPGFIDTHIHYPQMDVIASYGEQLLDWLEHYTFPAEGKFADAGHCQQIAESFLDELMANGTTTALVFGTVHPQSVDAFFTAAEARGLRMIAGKVLMDRHAPDFLRDTPEQGDKDSRELIKRWHNRGRLSYAVTPRFAPTSSDEQLTLAGKLLEEFPDVYLHTHLAENLDEVRWVSELFPAASGYLDVYDRFALLRPRAVFAHGIHLDQAEFRRLAETGSAIAFCPTSNLFLGSGLFNLRGAKEEGVEVGLATDVGGGTSFSLLQTLNEGYKVQQLRGDKLHPYEAFYLATLGGARALHLQDRIGSLAAGHEADFVVLDARGTRLMSQRMAKAASLEEQLFVYMMLGDDRAIRATYANGQSQYQREVCS